jgi:Bacterial archaeo-eukaryotic release factor family 2
MHLSFLRPLYERPGPWASVVLDASHETEDATKALDLRWRAVRNELAAQGTDEPTLVALENAILTHHPLPGRYGLAAFAARGEVALIEPIVVTPRDHIAAFGPLPHAMPLVAGYGEHVAWLRVVVDRTGADLLGATAGGVPRRGHVSGHNLYPIHKAKPGGWSAPRYQRAAEMSWERNAQEIAEAVADLARSVDAEIILVAGDPQARHLLVEHLPEWWRHRTVESDTGSRARGADPEPLDDATLQAIASLAARHVSEIVDRFRTEHGRDGAAGIGLPATVSALQRSQVDTVLLINDLSSTEHVWVGETPTEIAMSEAQLREMGTEKPHRVRADAGLLRALAATDGDLVLVTPDEINLDGGVGALLRYADASTRRR